MLRRPPRSVPILGFPRSRIIRWLTQYQNPLIEKRSRNYGIGQDIQPHRNLSRMVKWPEYIRLQRQKKILNLRLKVPPAISQFQHVLEYDALVSRLDRPWSSRAEALTDRPGSGASMTGGSLMAFSLGRQPALRSSARPLHEREIPSPSNWIVFPVLSVFTMTIPTR